MSTKNIARSALEGGRATYSKNERRRSHRDERSRLKQWLSRMSDDYEESLEFDAKPRNPVRRMSTDKLNPCFRWLASKVGQPWAVVRSEIAHHFDTRNLASWHIVNDHMLPSVSGAGTEDDHIGRYADPRFFIDDEGLLQDRGIKHWLKTKRVVGGPSLEAVLAVTKGRKVGGIFEDSRYWCHSGPGRWVNCSYPKRCEREHRVFDVTPASTIEYYEQPGMRGLGQGDWWRKYAHQHLESVTWHAKNKLTKAEIAWFNTIDWSIRSKIAIVIGLR